MATALQKAESDFRVQQSQVDFIDQRVKSNPTKPLNHAGVNDLVKKLDRAEESFDEIMRRISNVVVDEGALLPHTKLYTDELDKMLTLRDQLDEIKRSLPSTHGNPHSATIQQDIKLPPLSLPTFTGDIHEWVTFKDMFLAAVDTNKGYSNIQKFTYLKSIISGEAARLITSLDLSDANYHIAWKSLTDRYDNKRELLFSVMKKLFTQSQVSPNSATSLRGLIDQTKASIRSFSHIKGTEDHLFIYLMFSKLDTAAKEQWYQSGDASLIPSLDEFYKFLEQRALALSVGAPAKPQRPQYQDKPRAHAYHTQQQQDSCPLKCDQPHPIFRCPEFLRQSVSQRWDWIKRNSHCNNCLRGDHQVATCRSKSGCRTCGNKHNTLLHNNQNNKSNSPNEHKIARENQSQGSSQVTSHHGKPSSLNAALLATAVVRVRGPGGEHVFRALLDGGSSTSFITEASTRKLGLTVTPTNTEVVGLASAPVGSAAGVTSFVITPYFPSPDNFHITSLVIPKITSKLPSTAITAANWPHLHNLQLADPQFHTPSNIDILLGSDVFWHLLQNQKIEGSDRNQPLAIKSALGWIVAGNMQQHQANKINSFITNAELDIQLQRFWEMESTPTEQDELTQDEKACEVIFKTKHSRTPEGRFIVPIPWREPRPQLGSSRHFAMERLISMEQRLSTTRPDQTKNKMNEHFKNEYISFMREYESLAHMTRIPQAEILSPLHPTFYIPHHYVLKAESTTTKFRVVFDGSAKSSNGISLNDTMLVGPTVQSSLYSILLRFRTHVVVFTADITKMYRQVNLSPADSDLHRILWRESPSSPVKEYRLNTVTYGTASAPYLATRCLQQLAEENKQQHPLVSKILQRDFYVDDTASGSPDIPTAINTVQQLIRICESAAFPLRKFTSNKQEVLDSIPEDLRETKTIIPVVEEESTTIKSLRIYWKPREDTYHFHVNLPSTPAGNYTKRIILSEMSRLFDPLGWIAPVTIKAKILMQSIWKETPEWNIPLSLPLQHEWITLKSHLIKLEELTIPRLIITVKCTYHLVGYSDASEQAMAAVVYVCSSSKSIYPTLRLLTSKTKVAPVLPTTLPRLELNAAVLLAKLLTTVHKALDINFASVLAFSDSTITLGWINSDPTRWKTYVRNRVAKIQQATPQIKWSHVPGIANPADCASRGLYAEELLQHSLWWDGNPSILFQSQEINTDFTSVSDEEKKTVVPCNIANTTSEFRFFKYFSNMKNLLKFTMQVMRAQHNFKLRKKKKEGEKATGKFTANERNQAIIALIKYVQCRAFKIEISILSKQQQLPTNNVLLTLDPFLDPFGVLRVGGRLRNAPVPEDVKHPILLPRKQHLTSLIIEDAHRHLLHGGAQQTLSTLNQRYWIVRGRDAVRFQISKCIICAKQRAKTITHMMGNLPTARVTPTTRAFEQCGVDYCGPFYLKPGTVRSKMQIKSYLAIFICFVTRAIHIEVASSLSTEAFLSAFRRFISRRGKPTDVHSDCGTNFVGANRIIKQFKEQFQAENQIEDAMSREGIRWHFNPPAAPHFGGLWEAGVKSVKYHLHRVMGTTAITYEEFTTLTTQIEAILNSRPLTPLSSDPNDMQVLTPAHFLIGGPLTALPEPTLLNLNINRLDRWQQIQARQQSFWRRWSMEYISRLQQRPKWMKSSRPIQLNDIVIIKDENLPPAQWKLGRVMLLHPGKDGVIRVVTLRTQQQSELVRPVVKLCLLPVQTEDIEADSAII